MRQEQRSRVRLNAGALPGEALAHQLVRTFEPRRADTRTRHRTLLLVARENERSPMRNALRSSVLLGILLTSVPSHADAPVPASETAPASGDPVAELYNQAQNRYLEGDVEAALQFMEQCYELSHRPNLLYNLAQIYRELDRCEPALKNYRQYLKESPNGERREVAEHYVNELGKKCPPKESPSSPARASNVPSPPPEDVVPASPGIPTQTIVPERASYWTPTRQGGWILTAIGAAAAVGSVYFALQAREATRDAEQIQRDASDKPRPIWQERGGNARVDDFYYDRKLAIAFGGVSAAALGAGIVALVLAPSTPASRHGHVSLTVAPNTVGGGYRWRF